MKKILIVAFLLFPSLGFAQGLTSHQIKDFCTAPTRTATVSGNWSSTATWGGSAVPAAGAIVKINNGVTVTYDVNSAVALKSVCTSGLLDFGTSGTLRMVTSELQVYSDGELRIGTVASPFTGSATIEFSGTIDAGTVASPGTDVEQYGVGMIVIGKIRVHGIAKTPFVRLSAAPSAGATSVSLGSTPTAWNSGDVMVIPESKQRNLEASCPNGPGFYGGTCTIVKADRPTLSANVSTTTASFTDGLTYDHPCGLNAANTCDYYPHLANLTRNIVFKSANPTGVRAHGIAVERADIDVRYALFKDMGRTTNSDLNCTLFTTGTAATPGNCTAGTGAVTQIGTNEKGRYAFHFHHVWGPVNPSNTGYQATFIGNAVVDSTKWPVAIHNSNYVLFQQNVIAFGNAAGLMLEDGNEHFNTIDGNFFTASSGSGDPREQEGRESTGFWARGGANNYITNNVSAGHVNTRQQIVTDVGYKFLAPNNAVFTVKIPNFRGADLNIAGQYRTVLGFNVAYLQFENNEAYGMNSGLTIWNIGTEGYALASSMPVSTIKNFVAWNIYEQGIFAYPIYNFVFDGLIVRGDQTNLAYSSKSPVGFTTGDYKAHTVTLRNFDIQGIGSAIRDTSGIDGVMNYQNSISKTAFGVSITNVYSPGTGAPPLNPRQINITNVVHTPLSGRALSTIDMDWRADTAFPTAVQNLHVAQYQGGSQSFDVFFPEQASQNIAGGLAPCTNTTTFPEIDGIVCNVSGAGGGGAVPAAPTGLTIQ